MFRTIREFRPSSLYIIADGPKGPHDAGKCLEARNAVETIDWDCTVRRNYSEVNLGLRARVITGLDWVFQSEEKAVILEDDCLPHPTFFRFCEELLEYYRDDRRVMHISGDNFFLGRRICAASYYFSRYAHVWGWATWKRAWNLFHVWKSAPLAMPEELFQNRFEKAFWMSYHERIRKGTLTETWDYQWALTCMGYRSKCIIPRANLVTNIGFRADATTTKEKSSPAGNLPAFAMEFPLRHPREIQWNDYADRVVASKFFHGHMIWERRFSPWEIIQRLKIMVARYLFLGRR